MVIYVGIDWGTRQHHVHVTNEIGTTMLDRAVTHAATELTALCSQLLELAGSDPSSVRVALETPRGAVAETLLERCFELHSINPKQLDRFRDRFSCAGAKDDRLDARVLANSLRTDAHLFRRVRLEPGTLIELREWSRIHDELSDEHVRLTNQTRAQLLRYYEAFLECAGAYAVGADWWLDLWELIPTPTHAHVVKPAAIDRLLRKRRIRKIDAAHVRVVLGRTPVTTVAGTIDAAVAHIRLLVARLRVINGQLRLADRRIDELLAACELAYEEAPTASSGEAPIKKQRDVAILRSLPGVGRIVLAALLAEGWNQLQRADYYGLRQLAGTAPVTRMTGRGAERRKGKGFQVVMRRACNVRLRDALFHWAQGAMINDARARQHYVALRARGCSNGRALRGVGDRLLAIACAMLRDDQLYDPERRRLPKIAP